MSSWKCPKCGNQFPGTRDACECGQHIWCEPKTGHIGGCGYCQDCDVPVSEDFDLTPTGSWVDVRTIEELKTALRFVTIKAPGSHMQQEQQDWDILEALHVAIDELGERRVRNP